LVTLLGPWLGPQVNILLELIAIAFREETIAAQAAAELERRSDDLAIDPDAMGVIICERDGSCQLMTKRHPTATQAWSQFWSRVLEILMDDWREAGIDPGFRTRVGEILTPGTSILMAVATEPQVGRAIEALSQYGGRSLRCALANGGMAELREALDGNDAG
jgi:uncharacterized membrane protein